MERPFYLAVRYAGSELLDGQGQAFAVCVMLDIVAVTVRV